MKNVLKVLFILSKYLNFCVDFLTMQKRHSVHPLFLQVGGGGGVSMQPNFQEKEAWQDLNF